MGKAVIGVTCLILLIFGIYRAVESGGSETSSRFAASVNAAVAEASLAKQSQCLQNVNRLQTTGIIRKIEHSSGSVRVVYREDVWRGLEYDDKQRQLLLVYCAYVPSNGELVVMFRGNMKNERMGGVVNGHLN